MEPPRASMRLHALLLLGLGLATPVEASGLFLPSIDLRGAAVFLVAILIFTIGFEEATQRLEDHLKSTPHYAAILDKCYRELMILGFISLTVVFANEFHWIEDLGGTHADLLSFEFAHFLLFFVALFYILTTIVSSNRLHHTSKSWKRMCNADIVKTIDLIETEISNGNGDAVGFKPMWKALLPSFLIKSPNPWEDAQFKAFRLMFLKEFNLGTEFDYSKYVFMKVNHKLGHSLHVHPPTWVLVMFISLVFWWFRGLWPHGCEEEAAHRRLGGAAAPSDGCGGHRRLGGSDGSTNGTDDDGGGLMSVFGNSDDAWHFAGFLVPAVLGWLLLCNQFLVLYLTQCAFGRLLTTKGCKCANDLPKFMRALDSELEMKHLLEQMPMFEGCGREFLDGVMANLSQRACTVNQQVCQSGADADSMMFLCRGWTDVRSADGKTLGTLGPGDHFGDGALLSTEKRMGTVSARTRCVLFELKREALTVLGDAYPAAVQKILTFCLARAQSESAGIGGAAHVGHMQDLRAKETNERLKHLKRLQEAKNADPERKMNLRNIANPFTAPKRLASSAKALASNVAASPIQTAKKAVKSGAHLVGIPGTGIAKPQSGHNAHQHLDRMEGADEIMPHSRSHLFEEINEITLLFNCFTLGFYALHIMPVIIPNFVEGYFAKGFAHFSVLFPALIVMWGVAPICTKYTCLLDNVMFKDQDTIAEVYHEMTLLISEKNAIKKQLMKVGMQLAHDVGMMDDLDIGTVAALIYRDIDSNNDGRLTYTELRNGLADFQVYLSKKEFKSICECIDPDLDGGIDLEEWVEFLRSTDEQLAKNEWRSHKLTMAVRKRLSAELVKKVMFLESGTSPSFLSKAPGDLSSTEGMMRMIFETMDTDNSQSLSITELREGLVRYGIHLKASDMDAIGDHILKEGYEGQNGGHELSMQQWLAFVRAHQVPDMEVAGPERTSTDFDDNPLAGDESPRVSADAQQEAGGFGNPDSEEEV